MSETTLKIGQVWVENDKRFYREVMILSLSSDGKVVIKTVNQPSHPSTIGRITVASARRFNGKRRGYSLLADVADALIAALSNPTEDTP